MSKVFIELRCVCAEKNTKKWIMGLVIFIKKIKVIIKNIVYIF